MENQEKRSSYDWKAMPQYKDTTICDPDGWNRTNADRLHASMSELITETEFMRRLQRSTCMMFGETKTPFVDAEGREVSDIAVRRFVSQIEAWQGPIASREQAREIVAKYSSNDLRDILMVQPTDLAVKVEWDASFRGGDYAGVGEMAYVPVALINNHGGSVAEAFRVFMQRDPDCIVHYESDAQYTVLGEMVDDTEHSAPGI